jgi:cytochrome b involved in lipid metabolism
MVSHISDDQLIELIKNGKKLLYHDNIVYDVTNYQHPGGECIFKKILKLDSNNNILYTDITIDYNFHSSQSKKVWKSMIIGTTETCKLTIFLNKLFCKY